MGRRDAFGFLPIVLRATTTPDSTLPTSATIARSSRSHSLFNSATTLSKFTLHLSIAQLPEGRLRRPYLSNCFLSHVYHLTKGATTFQRVRAREGHLKVIGESISPYTGVVRHRIIPLNVPCLCQSR